MTPKFACVVSHAGFARPARHQSIFHSGRSHTSQRAQRHQFSFDFSLPSESVRVRTSFRARDQVPSRRVGRRPTRRPPSRCPIGSARGFMFQTLSSGPKAYETTYVKQLGGAFACFEPLDQVLRHRTIRSHPAGWSTWSCGQHPHRRTTVPGCCSRPSRSPARSLDSVPSSESRSVRAGTPAILAAKLGAGAAHRLRRHIEVCGILGQDGRYCRGARRRW